MRTLDGMEPSGFRISMTEEGVDGKYDDEVYYPYESAVEHAEKMIQNMADYEEATGHAVIIHEDWPDGSLWCTKIERPSRSSFLISVSPE